MSLKFKNLWEEHGNGVTSALGVSGTTPIILPNARKEKGIIISVNPHQTLPLHLL
jgi:hypothetical protein